MRKRETAWAQLRVPCCLNEEKLCSEPFCRMNYFFLMAEKERAKWIANCYAELDLYKGELKK